MLASRSPTRSPIWSYMSVSSQCARENASCRKPYSVQCQLFLENLALAFGGSFGDLAEPHGGCAGRAMEGAHEIREIGKADIIGDICDRAVVVGQPARGMAQPRAHEVLVRSDAQHLGEQPQEMERADAGLLGAIVEGDGAMRI